MQSQLSGKQNPFSRLFVVGIDHIDQRVASGVRHLDLMLAVGAYYLVSAMAPKERSSATTQHSPVHLPNVRPYSPPDSVLLRRSGHFHPRFESREASTFGPRDLKSLRRRQRRAEQRVRATERRTAKLCARGRV